MKLKLITILLILAFVLSEGVSWAQCAMCKASVESNMLEKQPGIGLSINDGILYLMLMPYIMFGVFGYLWYRNTHKKTKDAK